MEMYKCWYYLVNGSTKGPFALEELRRQPYFTLDSLVWKEGFSDWRPAREVKEIRELFEAPEPPEPQEDKAESVGLREGEGEVAVVEKKEPPFLILWLLILVLLLIYLLWLKTF
jgi:hypothetical protein